VTIQLGHLARNVLINVKKRQRREIGSAVMSDRRDMDGYTKIVSPGTKSEKWLGISPKGP
jgi:hypothetical protein